MPDHVHMCLSIPPKYSVAHTIGKLKGKSAILVHQKFGRRKNVTGFRFWSRGYCASTLGLEEKVIRQYIQAQEERDIHEEQLSLNY
jgi:putative transposase